MEWVYSLSWSGMARDEERVRGPSTVQPARHRTGSPRVILPLRRPVAHVGSIPCEPAQVALLLHVACLAEGMVGTGLLWGGGKR